MTDRAGMSLAAQQQDLVAALLGRGPFPAGFDVGRLQVAAASLAAKRSRSAARAWLHLSRSLGAAWNDLFASYSAEVLQPAAGGPRADGRAFARWLASRGKLPDAGRLQAIDVDLHFASRPDGLVRRRGPAFRATWLRDTRRLILGVRLPWFGVRCLRIPFGLPGC